MVERLISRLQKTLVYYNEPRLQSIMGRALEHIEGLKGEIRSGTNAEILRQILSKMWELTIACFFDGEEIRLGARVSELFPDQFNKAVKGQNFVLKRSGWTREIDIAVLNWNRTWRWIEVKDWAQYDSTQNRGRDAIISQSHGQHGARELLPGWEIEISLVLKYGLPSSDLEQYKERSRFDHILFAFPGGDHHAQKSEISLTPRAAEEDNIVRHENSDHPILQFW